MEESKLIHVCIATGRVHYAIIPHKLQIGLIVSCEPAAGVTPVPVIRERVRASGSEHGRDSNIEGKKIVIF
jgi:hypothetical protein